MIDYEIANLAIAAVSAIAAIVAAIGIWNGIAAMVSANKQRAAFLDQQRKADDQRHAEAMAAHRAAAEADERRHAEAMEESARRHAEAMEESARRHAETMATLDRQRQADDKRHAETMAALEAQTRTLADRSRALEAQAPWRPRPAPWRP